MEKLKCYRTVLLSDLVSESRLRIQTKQTGRSVSRLRRPNTAPTLAPTGDKSGMQSTSTSSTSGSFHSARESAFDWPSDSPLHAPPRLDFHETEFSIQSSQTVPLSGPERRELFETPLSSPKNDRKDRSDHPHRDSSSENISQGDDDDQAEDWNKTRAAQRVSLIHFPSDFAIATRLKAVFEAINNPE